MNAFKNFFFQAAEQMDWIHKCDTVVKNRGALYSITPNKKSFFLFFADDDEGVV